MTKSIIGSIIIIFMPLLVFLKGSYKKRGEKW